MAEPLGALIVELRLESAKFKAEMDSARVSMHQTGESATVSSRQIARLASQGFGAVLPISFQAERALERFIEKTLKAQGALGLLAKGTLLVGAGLAAFKVGEKIGEIISLGTTMEKYEEQTRKATEAQKQFLDQLTRQSSVLHGLQSQLAQAQGIQGADVAAAQAERDARIRQTFAPTKERDNALAISAQIAAEQTRKALEEQRKLRDDNEQKVLDQLRKERDEQLKAWQTETSFLADELKTRLKMRQDFEAQLGQGGLPGQEAGAAGGLAAVRRFREQIQKEARDLSFLEREGLISQTDSTQAREGIRTRAIDEARRLKEQFQGLPAVLEAVDRAISSVEFGNLGRELATARTEIDSLVPTLDSLRLGLGQFAAQLVALPRAADPASVAVRQLSRDYIDLGNAINFANAAQAALVTQ